MEDGVATFATFLWEIALLLKHPSVAAFIGAPCTCIFAGYLSCNILLLQCFCYDS